EAGGRVPARPQALAPRRAGRLRGGVPRGPGGDTGAGRRLL
ncbi:MAG: hypothetical protein AVDCRST_MAG02-568, partial [uncultured Rubrobacteraceae bacterium]